MMINRRRVVVEIIVLIVVLVSVLVMVIAYQSPYVPPSIELPPSKFCPEQYPILDPKGGIEVTNSPLSDGEFVGLSEGDFAFNILGPGGTLKCQASQALHQGRIKDAEMRWKKALQYQSNDAEMLIYQENQQVLDAKLPYVNVIVGVIATETVMDDTKTTETVIDDTLQGTYVAQKRYNQDHKNGIQIRVIIANFGSTSASARLVAQQIIVAAQKDDRIKAMVDLPALANISDVINILSDGDFPIVLSTGSASSQENGKNIFHIEATVEAQGQQAAEYVEQKCPNRNEPRPFDCEGPNVGVFIDLETADRYSNTLGSAFMEQLLKDGAANRTDKVVKPYFYDSANPHSIVDRIREFGDSPPDLIYFSGDATNADILLQSLPRAGKYVDLRVLGGDALYQTGQYRAGDYRRLNFTTFAYPDEWSILKSASAAPEFFCDYAKDFAGGVVSSPKCSGWQTSADGIYGYGYSRPENDVVLSYDALEVILVGSKLDTVGSIPPRDQLLQSLRSINEAHPFAGVSGPIAFGSDGNPINKAILVLRVNDGGYTRQEQQYGTF